MKILIIAFVNKGGALTDYLSQLCNALVSTNKVILIAPHCSKTESFSPDVEMIHFSMSSNSINSMLQTINPFLFVKLTKKINHINPDVIHIAFEPRFPFSFTWLLHRKYPIVTTIHELKPLPIGIIRTLILNRIQIIDNKLLVKFSDKVIVHGKRDRKYLLAHGVPSYKIEVIPHGNFCFYTHYREDEIIEVDNNNILFFGRMASYKGLGYLIEAGKNITKHISNATINATITIACKGDFSKYKKIIGQDNTFIILDRFIPNEEVAELFKKTSVVVLPYIAGTQSGIITIAGSFKKPIVVTDVGNFSDMVENGKTGFIVPPKNANALAEAIIRLLNDDKLRHEMGDNAYKMVKEKFSWDNIAQRILETYKEAVEARGKKALNKNR